MAVAEQDTITVKVDRVPAPLWRRFRSRLALEGQTVQPVLVELIRQYLEASHDPSDHSTSRFD
jgi:hypothetical protein